VSDTVEPAPVERHHPLAKCEICPLYKKSGASYVPTNFNGNTTADVVYVGEAPGNTEVKKGKPFVGMSGRLLNEVLKEHGIKRNEGVYTNVCLCRPPSNATPNAEMVAACKPALDDAIEKAQPEFVVALGKTAAEAVLGKTVKITRERVGPPKQIKDKPYKVIPTVHPAACLRNTNLFPALVSDIGKIKQSVYVKWEPPKWKAVDDPAKGERVIAELFQRGNRLVMDAEVGEDKDVQYGHPNTLLCMGIAYEPGKAVVLGENALRSRKVRHDLSKLIDTKQVTWHNAKYDLGVLYRMGFGELPVVSDTMLMSYTQNEVPGTHGLKYLGKEHLGAPDWDAELKSYKNWSDIPKPQLYEYNAYDVVVTWDIEDLLRKRMDSDDKRLHEYLCWAATQVMLIESDGIYIDRTELQNVDTEVSLVLEQTKEELQLFVAEAIDYDQLHPNTARLIRENEGFNPNSHVQVRGVLELLLGATLTTTDAEMLEMIVGRTKRKDAKHLAEKMLTWRKDAKMYGTYVKGLRERLDEDGRVRTTFFLHGTETGRLSSRNPNVQNVPRKTAKYNIRRVYAAEPGNLMMYADYSNIEGRIVCTLAQDDNMREVLSDPNRDIHGEMAEDIFSSAYSKEQRVKAKSVVHGKNYDRTAHGIASDLSLGLSVPEADKISRAYDMKYPNVKVWQVSIKRQVLETDDVLITPWGRKRRFGLITSDNMEDVYKEGLAFKPQSIGSDICLTAAVRLREQGVQVRNLVHDGLLIEAPQEEINDLEPVVREVMEQSGRDYTDYVPFPIDIAIGKNWGEVD
jgi:uracil-DNA glycosylase family 4